jgi:hypothetical protein
VRWQEAPRLRSKPGSTGGRPAGSRRSARFAFAVRNPCPTGLRRIARGQIDSAIERLSGDTEEDLGTAVHESRKSFKRLRAVVRLARDGVGDETYDRENTTFRDLGRGLAEVRDREVIVDTLGAVLQDRHDALGPDDVRAFRTRLIDERDRARERTQSDRDVLARAVSELARARTRTDGWTFLHPGLRGGRARAAPDLPARTANLPGRPQGPNRGDPARVAQAGQGPLVCSPDPASGLSAAHEGTRLNGARRLEPARRRPRPAVLAAEARRGRAELGDEATLIGLEGLIERRRAALQRRALTAGGDLYARKPRQFVGRIERRWNKRVGSATPASA